MNPGQGHQPYQAKYLPSEFQAIIASFFTKTLNPSLELKFNFRSKSCLQYFQRPFFLSDFTEYLAVEKTQTSMTSFIKKLKGDNAPLPPKPSQKAVGLAWLGGFFAISALALLTNFGSVTLVLGSFGASCVLVFGYPDLPFSQPRNVIVGHFISSLIGLIFLTVFGPHWWSVAMAVGTAIALMMLTRTVHPPAGSNPVIVFLSQPAWGFLLFPTLIGALVLTAVALVYNNATRDTKYPKYW